MAKAKKKTQQTLESTLGRSRIAPATKTPKKMTTRSALKQSKLPSSLSPAVKNDASSSPSGAFFMSSQVPNAETPTKLAVHTRSTRQQKKQYLVDLDDSSSSESDIVEEGAVDAAEREEEECVTGVQPGKRNQKMAVIESDSDDTMEDEDMKGKEAENKEEDEEDSEDNVPLPTPMRTRKRPVVDSDEESDLPVRSSPVKRRRVVARMESSDEDEDEEAVSARKTRTIKGAFGPVVIKNEPSSDEESDVAPVRTGRLARRNAPSSPVIKKDSGDEKSDAVPMRKIPKLRKKPLNAKEKARELLRRKRAGEVIEEEEEEEDESEEDEEPRRALYDTDSDNLALDEFEDDEESEREVPKEAEQDEKQKKKKDKKRKKRKEKDIKQDGSGEDVAEEDLEDFVVDDSDEPLGAPDEALHAIPIEFTRASHKPLKDHFRDVIEWLVQYKINPGFADKTHSMYALAWRKMDDEVRALADSKFSSSAWRPDFFKALRARPYYVNEEIAPRGLDPMGNCAACGRSGHVAKWSIKFSGTPYFKNFGPDFLTPIEPDSDDDGDAGEDEDEDGNAIPKEDRVWNIGNVCNDNAEIAHTLLHWKNSLLDWVDTRLMEDGHMVPGKLAERARWKPKKLYKLVDEIVEGWEKQGVVKSLYRDFKSQLERARSQGTGGRRRY